MTSYSLESLGAVVSALRREKGLTQQQLGERAGYQAGAGVAISRLENGQLRPGRDKLEGVARALGISTDELAIRAADGNDESERSARPSIESVDNRIARISREIERQRQLERDLEAFNEARDRANELFLIRFSAIAARIGGSPARSEQNIESIDGEDADVEAKYQIRFTTIGVSAALAGRAGDGAADARSFGGYKAFVQAVALGLASTGAKLLASSSGESRALGGYSAAVHAGQVAARGASASGGNAFVLGLVAGAAVVGFADLLTTAERKRKRMKQDLDAELEKVEAAAADIKSNVDALRELVPKATETLEYIAVHAGHALGRWESQLGLGVREWNSLNSADRRRYESFVDIAAAQLAVAGIDIAALWMARTDQLEEERRLADRVLTQASLVITSHV
ncbi:helix-turn-helix domain-containing protein [Agromyces mariniharenae]|nr:helix-turn-helix transcriptional regulator [Agromyces mariniharenae]